MLRNSAMIGQHFAFAHGRTGVLQLGLLTQSDLDRLLGAHDAAEVHMILREVPLTKLLENADRDPENVLNALGTWVRTEVTNMVPKQQQDAFDILWMEGDAPLLAFLLKERLTMTTSMSRRPTPPVTAFPIAQWTRLVLEQDATGFPTDIAHFVRTTLATEARDPAMIDTAVAAFLSQRARILAHKSGSTLLKNYVRHDIDMQNIRTALRVHTIEERRMVLLEGGCIETHAFTKETPPLAAVVRRHGYHALADALEESAGNNATVERALNAIRADDIAALWNQPLTIEPVFAFAATALAQLSLLRALLIGKQSNLTPQDIKKLLPPSLSATHFVS